MKKIFLIVIAFLSIGTDSFVFLPLYDCFNEE